MTRAAAPRTPVPLRRSGNIVRSIHKLRIRISEGLTQAVSSMLLIMRVWNFQVHVEFPIHLDADINRLRTDRIGRNCIVTSNKAWKC